jgi:hypothetical protein
VTPFFWKTLEYPRDGAGLARSRLLLALACPAASPLLIHPLPPVEDVVLCSASQPLSIS